MKDETTKGIDLGRRKALSVGAAIVSAHVVGSLGCSDDSGDGGAGGTGSGSTTTGSSTKTGSTTGTTSGGCW